MAIAEKLNKRLEGTKTKMTEKSQKAEKGKGVEIDLSEWLLLFLGAGFIDILFILLAIIGLIPVLGQIIYVVADPIMNIMATGIFWLYLQNRGLSHYWWLAFGGGVANLIPVINWAGWIISVLILYFLIKAEKIPFAGEAIEKAAKAASKIE